MFDFWGDCYRHVTHVSKLGDPVKSQAVGFKDPKMCLNMATGKLCFWLSLNFRELAHDSQPSDPSALGTLTDLAFGVIALESNLA